MRFCLTYLELTSPTRPLASKIPLRFRHPFYGQFESAWAELASYQRAFDSTESARPRALSSVSLSRVWSFEKWVEQSERGWNLKLDLDGYQIEAGFLPDAQRSNSITAIKTYAGIGIGLTNLNEELHFSGSGGILPDLVFETETDTWMVGPQLQLGTVFCYRRWSISLESAYMFGYGSSSFNQSSALGNGSVISPLSQYEHAAQKDELAQMLQVSAISRFFVREGVSMDLGARWYTLTPTYDANNATLYRIPDLGIRLDQADDFNGGFLFAGVTINI